MQKPETTLLTDEQREIVIQLLVDDWFNSFAGSYNAMSDFIHDALTVGRVGYYDHEDWELIDLADEAELFDEQGE